METILVKCLTLKDMVMVNAIGTMDAPMKDTGRMTWQMVKENQLIPMAIFTKECGKTIKDMDMAKKQ